ncbi:MAG: hypothetical protein ACO331_01660 [Prochlorothrix sp.]
MITPPPTPPPSPPLPPSLPAQWLQQHIADPAVCRAAFRLHQLQVRLRWFGHGVLWLVLLPPSLWALSPEFELWREALTWAAVRYGLLGHPWAAAALFFLIATTLETLLWQGRNILLGMPRREVLRLAEQVQTIQEKGSGHWLWPWLWGRDPWP